MSFRGRRISPFSPLCRSLSILPALLAAGPASAQGGAVTALAFSPDGQRLAVGGHRQALLFSTETWKPAGAFTAIEDSARCLAWSADNATLAIGSGLAARSGRLTLWDTTGANPPRALLGQKDSVETVAFRSDGRALLFGAADNTARYFAGLPPASGRLLDEHNDRVTAAAIAPQPDSFFATGARDRLVKVWDAKTGHSVLNLDQSQAGITGLAFLPSGNQLVAANLEGKLIWWQIGPDEDGGGISGRRYRQVDAHPESILCMAISGDGQRLITGGPDGTVTIWNAASGARIKDLKESGAPIYAAALSPDGKMAAAGGREGVVRVWSVEDGKLLHSIPLPKPPAPPAPAKSGKMAATGRR